MYTFCKLLENSILFLKEMSYLMTKSLINCEGGKFQFSSIKCLETKTGRVVGDALESDMCVLGICASGRLEMSHLEYRVKPFSSWPILFCSSKFSNVC